MGSSKAVAGVYQDRAVAGVTNSRMRRGELVHAMTIPRSPMDVFSAVSNGRPAAVGGR
jgi:hypothetical protein